jgi:diguanylate cyclase (GGDEF)-like protein
VGLFVATLDTRAASEVLLALANMAVVVAATWLLSWEGQGVAVLLAAAGWTGARLDPASLLGPWDLPREAWLDLALRGSVLVSLWATVAALRQSVRRLLRTEDDLAVTLLRERDSARRDRLTRLWNARYLHEVLEQEIARCRRYGRPFGLLAVDLDGFKAVNDTGGHEAGDAVLRTVGRVLHESCRTTDFPARLGGDEFVIVLPEASSLTVPRYAARLVERIAEAPYPPALPRVTASIGGVAFQRPPASVKAALALADEAMYAAKREGKNRFAVLRAEAAG